MMTDENKNMFLGEVQITGARNAQSPSALNMNSDYRQIRQTVGTSDAISHRVEKKNGQPTIAFSFKGDRHSLNKQQVEDSDPAIVNDYQQKTNLAPIQKAVQLSKHNNSTFHAHRQNNMDLQRVVTSESQKSVKSGESSTIAGKNTWERIQNQMQMYCNHMDITTSSVAQSNSIRGWTPNQMSSMKGREGVAYIQLSQLAETGMSETLPSKNTIQPESQGNSEK